MKSPDGDDVLKPITEQIRELRDEIFCEDRISARGASMTPVDLVKAEAPKLMVMNGTVTPGLAAITTEYLQSQGIPVTTTGNADKVYASTAIFDYTGKYTPQIPGRADEHQPPRSTAGMIRPTRWTCGHSGG